MVYMENQAANQGSPFEIVSPKKSKKAGNKGIIVAILIVVFLILSVVAGVLLVRQRQLIQQKAVGNTCPGVEACPFAQQPTLLISCHPTESDGSPTESLCNVAGRVETCGPALTKYCCPAAGASWTTNMTVCNQLASPSPSATATATATPTATPTASATATPTASATAAASSSPAASATATPTATATALASATASPTTTPAATPMDIPVTGTDWPTLVGAGLGILVIVASILIAL